MLCPEVWNFEPPPFSVSTDICKSEEEIFKKIRHQYFNHHVSITLPDTIQVPDYLTDSVLEDSEFYRINKVYASQLLRREFLDLFVRKGQLTAVSIGDSSDQNSLVITPGGILILSVCQSTYYQLGIQDTFTENPKSCLKKYYLCLDLRSETSEGRKKCEQVQKKLSVNCNLCFDIILAWEPEEVNICPSSIAYYFSKLDHFVKTCKLHYERKLKFNVAVPVYDDETDVCELTEWLGAFNLGCDLSEVSYISSFKCPEKNQTVGQVMHITFTGLLTQSRVHKLISELIKYIKIRPSETWIGLSVQSFQNSIINVKKKHLYFTEGDQNFSVIFMRDNPFLIYMFRDKKKT